MQRTLPEFILSIHAPFFLLLHQAFLSQSKRHKTGLSKCKLITSRRKESGQLTKLATDDTVGLDFRVDKPGRGSKVESQDCARPGFISPKRFSTAF